MRYNELVKYYERLEKTTKRLEKTAIIEELLKKTKEEHVIYLIEGRVFPEWDERKINFSNRLMIKAISSVSGANAKNVEILLNKKGDLGIVAEELIKRKKQAVLRSKELTTEDVFNNIRKLAELEGEGTVSRKISLVSELLSNAKEDEVRYVVRTVLEQLRVGTAQGILRDAISKAFDKNAEDVENAFNLVVDFGEVFRLAREDKLKNIELKPGRPLKLMLAVLVKNVEEGFEALGKPMQLEFKIDGFRLEIHKSSDGIKLFTRRMEDVTKQFPEAVEYAKEHINGKEFILDAEAVGFDDKTKKYLPFQSISQRIKRKYDIEEIRKKFPVEVNVFDVIYHNGKSLMNLTLKERREILEKIIDERKWKIVLTKKIITNDKKEAEDFYNDALEAGMEGIMLKNINSIYVPGRYVNGWCKLKNILDPLDLAIVKAEWGEGKRAKWLSSYTIACQKDGELIEVGKVSTGVKEKAEGMSYEQMTKLLKPLIITQKGKEVNVKPKIVIEVGYEEIQKSPTYSSGYALRFPKFLKYRPEKPIDEIADIKMVEKIYRSQRGKK